MLTEKWLEDTIRKHVAGVLRRTAVEDGVAFRAIGYAAAAIHARLSEGVAWRRQGKVRHDKAGMDGSGRWQTYVDVGPEGFNGSLRLCNYKMEQDGQLVSVTVKIVEGTKDES